MERSGEGGEGQGGDRATLGVTDWCHRFVSQIGCHSLMSQPDLGAAGEPRGCFQRLSRVGLVSPAPPDRGDSVGRALGVPQLAWACPYPAHLGMFPSRTPVCIPSHLGVSSPHTWARSHPAHLGVFQLTWACPLAPGRVPAHLGAPPPPHFRGEGPRWGGEDVACPHPPHPPPIPPPIPHLRARRRQAPPRAPLIGCGGRGGSLAMRARAAAPESAAAGAGRGARNPGSRTARGEERAKPPETARNHG